MIALDTMRAVTREMCAARGITLVSPTDNPLLRLAVATTIAIASPLTLAEVRERVSNYVSRLLADVVSFLPDSVTSVVDIDAPLMLISPIAWNDAGVLAATTPHELGHHARDLGVRAGVPPIPFLPPAASLLWGAGYVFVPRVRMWEESTSALANLTVAVVVRNEDPNAAAAGIIAALREAYRPGDAMDAAESTMASGVASLLAGELPGVGTPVVDVLKRLRAKGESFGRWDAVIDA